MDEKEMIPGTQPEETAAEPVAAEENTEEIAVEIEASFTVTDDEEVDEETAEILAEQDSLDGEVEEKEAADPLEVALLQATEAEAITAEEAAMVRDRIESTQSTLQKAKSTIKKLMITVGCLVAALVISLAAVAGFWMNTRAEKPFTGLEVGKSYAGNIKLPDYTTVTYTDTYVAPTEKEVQDKINTALTEAKKTTEKDVTDALQDGDVTVLDFNGYVDGQKLDSACATDQSLTLGSDTFIPGFEDGLVGKKVGEKVTLDLVFPDDYTETSLRGKAVKFDVTIKSAKRTIYPTLTDALVKEISEEKYATVDAYKQSVYDELDASAKTSAADDARNEVWTTVAEGTKLKKYPKNMYNYYMDKLDKQYSSYYSSYGVTDLAGFMTKNNLDLDTYIKNQIVYEYAIYTIAAKQGITLTDEDFTSMMTKYGCTTKEQLVETLGVESFELEASLLYDKVSNYLLEVATVN